MADGIFGRLSYWLQKKKINRYDGQKSVQTKYVVTFNNDGFAKIQTTGRSKPGVTIIKGAIKENRLKRIREELKPLEVVEIL